MDALVSVGADAEAQELDPGSDATSSQPPSHLARALRDEPPGRTLLPAPVASAVSFATRSTGLALRLSTLIGGYGFDAAKFTTLSSLELGRGMLEGMLARAGNDTIRRSRTEVAREDAESILEKSLDNLHRTINSLVFWTTTGFHVTGRTLSTLSDVSQLLLTTLDQFFGSTDSSRAIASIITLIRREFQNPASGMQGERVSVVDLVLGLCGLAYLQAVCSRLIEEENRNRGVDEVVWDVVVLRSGERVDVHHDSLYGVHTGTYGSQSARAIDRHSSSDIVSRAEEHGAPGRTKRQRHDGEDNGDGEEDDLPEIRLKRQIMDSLPQGAKVSITTSIATTKTITVDITGANALHLSPPEGVEVVEDSRDSAALSLPSPEYTSAATSARYRVVYQVGRSQERSTSFKREGGEVVNTPGFIEPMEDNEIGLPSPKSSPPPVPPKPSTGERPLYSRRPSAPASSTAPSSTPKSTRRALTELGKENSANQKRSRMPPSPSPASTVSNFTPPRRKPSIPKLLPAAKPRDDPRQAGTKVGDKKGGFRIALKKGPGPALSTLLHRDDSGSDTPPASRRGKQREVVQATSAHKSTKASQARTAGPPRLGVPGRNSSLVPQREAPRPPSRTSRAAGPGDALYEPYPRASSRASYISVHESRRDSIVSQTDTFSIHTLDDYQPTTPTIVRADLRASGGPIVMSRPEKDVSSNAPGSPLRAHRHTHSQVYTPSIYTLRTNDSQCSLVPYSYLHHKSAFGDPEALSMLRRDGMVDGIFPKYHILRNVTRYMRFASASYGSNFLRGMGMAKQMSVLRTLDDTHHELHFFAHHTESDASSILLSSFVDQQGGSDWTGSTNSGIPLVHYISLDHESKAVVLACRGTLGFEDVLADLACEYDDLMWRGSVYKVHKGIHASARRLLYGGDGRVLVTLRQALEEFTDYGLVLTGHSLGGAVTALLGIMLSEPATTGVAFLTSPEPHARLLGCGLDTPEPICLPPGRPVHVYAYGPPATMSASLSRATRGLITSIVNGNDLVPYLSLGVLHDVQAVALGFKSDNNAAKMEVKQRIWDAFHTGLADRWYNNRTARQPSTEDDAWAYAALKLLRASMTNQKLLPPGEVFSLENTKVLRRDAFLREGEEQHLGRPASRIVLRYVKDVEKRFGEGGTRTH
ncbi:hypothetical protein GQ53DRAFT_810965 [Thozetella sp. PMI_491]|nr:hypothetical protein GQ53DRAFT_810965 [Thozetella sp. PMI_491]